MRAAVIDIGSNSTKLFIGEKVGDDIKILESLKNIIGIGKNTFFQSRISREIFQQIISVLDNYKKVIQQYDVATIKVIATTAVREAQNRDIFLDTVTRKTGFKVEVLNVGDVVYFIDAFLSYKLKKRYPINEKNLLIAELGAGSLDVSLMEKGFSQLNVGIPTGTLRLKQFKSQFEGSRKETHQAVEEYVEKEMMNLRRTITDIKIDDIVLIDESYSTALNELLPSERREQSFFQFHYRESRQLLTRALQYKPDDLAEKYNVPPDIVDTVDAYALIVNNLFKLTKKRSIYILETSLSEALLANMIFGFDLAEKYNKSNQLVSVTKFICRKYGADPRHSKQVATLAETLFHSMREVLGLDDGDLLYLQLAAYLHNIGMFVSNRAHHKHTEYIVSSLSLFRLTSQEIKCIACIARYHRKAHPQKSHLLYNSLSLSEQLLVQKLASLLRMANALDISHRQKVKQLEAQVNTKGQVKLVVLSTDSLVLEKVIFAERKRLFEEVSGLQVGLTIKRE